MIFLVRTDKLLAWLKCDDCGRTGCDIRLPLAYREPGRIRLHLGLVAGKRGWGRCPSIERGHQVVIDLCPRCCRKLRAVL